MPDENFKEIVSTVKQLFEPQRIAAADGENVACVYTVPANIQVLDMAKYIDAQRPAPVRRKGTARLGDLPSFIAHVNRFKDTDSAIFADNSFPNPCLTGVLNYNRIGATGAPQFGDHRAVYNFPFSKEWNIWNGKDSEGMNQSEFAAFIEDNINDILAPEDADVASSEALQKIATLLGGNFAGPSTMVTLSRGLSVYESAAVETATNLNTGEGKIVFKSEHNDAAGAPIKVPNMFLLGIPVFENGDSYRIAVRLRYRLKQGSLTWFYQLYQINKAFDSAFKEASDNAAKATELPLFLGNPEA